MAKDNNSNENSIISADQLLPNKLTLIPLAGRPIFPGIFTPLMINSADDVKVVEEAYTLEDGQAQKAPTVLCGVIAEIPTPWSDEYGNITVNIVCGGLEDLKIQCYRLAGGADLAVGDTITVSGIIKNYKGTIEFDKNCTYTK